MDEQGRKMSKSLGNGVDPLKVVNDMGADILRLWVASADYRNDVAVSQGILKQVSEAYRKIRNTFRYLLGNINDFNYKTDAVALKDMEELDQWIVLKLHKLLEKVNQAYEDCEFHVVYHSRDAGRCLPGTYPPESAILDEFLIRPYGWSQNRTIHP